MARKNVEPEISPDAGPPITFKPAGDDHQQQQARLIEARKYAPAFVMAKELLADAIHKRGEKVLMDFSAQSAGVRFEVDGVWHNLPARDRQSGDMILAILKLLAGLNPQDRRNRQEGSFKANLMGAKYACRISSQGVQTGERIVLQLRRDDVSLNSLEQLGMRQKMRDRFRELVNAKSGLVIVSAPPGGGLSTLWSAAVRGMDRYVRDCFSVEDVNAPEEEVENVAIETFDQAAGKTPDQIFEKLLLKQPEALLVPEVVNQKTMEILLRQVMDEDRFVMIRVAANDASEALLRAMAQSATVDKFSTAVSGVLNQRLIRKLCTACKQPFQPHPQLFQRLGIPAGRVRALYREWQPPPPEQQDPKNPPQPCGQCGGIGYYGRTGVFELLVAGDPVKQAIRQKPQLEVVRQVARQAGNHSLQEEGIFLLSQGVISLNELQRVFSQGSA